MKFFLVFLCSVMAFGQQSNGRNYTLRTQQLGETAQTSNDSGVNPLELGSQFAIGNIAPAAFLSCSYFVISPDTTKQHGCAIRNNNAGVPGTLICGAMSSNANPTVPAPVSGWNTRTLSGCAAPTASSTPWVTSFTASGSQEPGAAQPFSATTPCPGSALGSDYSNSLTGPPYSFGTYKGQQGTQPWCYSAYVTVSYNQGSNGLNFNTPYGIPTGPWGINGKWYGGTNSAVSFVDFSGLSNGVAPTTTALNNSTHGSAITWTTATGNITGDNTTSLGLTLSPAVISGTAYAGNSTWALKYTTSTSSPGGYIIATLGSSYSILNSCYTWETSVPTSDSGQYDGLKIVSADGNDGFLVALLTSGNSEWMVGEETEGASTFSSTSIVPISPNKLYRICQFKNTNGANNIASVYDNTGTLIGTITLASASGSHPANTLLIGATGNEGEGNGFGIWWSNLAICGGNTCVP